jgi:Uma2 family endonuclease
MSSTVNRTRTEEEKQADPFRYGFRDIIRTLPDGTTEYDQVPLTLEDALHPQEGDWVVHNQQHEREIRYLCDTFDAQLADNPHATLLSDCKVEWGGRLKHHSPDVAIVLGTSKKFQNLSEFNCVEQGVRPCLIIEIVSPATRSNDVEKKHRQYWHRGVQTYVIVDRVRDDDVPTLRGYSLGAKRYVALEPDANGRLWLETVGVFLAVKGDTIVCFDRTGKEIQDHLGTLLELNAIAQERDALAVQNEHLLARLRELEAKPKPSGQH